MWELGFWTRTSQQRRGIMYESLTALVDWMKHNNPHIEILTRHDVNNIGSMKLVEKLGFKPVDEYMFESKAYKMYSSNPQGVEL
jgi:RimJ/RimL family protein N-acetyltransferase